MISSVCPCVAQHVRFPVRGTRIIIVLTFITNIGNPTPTRYLTTQESSVSCTEQDSVYEIYCRLKVTVGMGQRAVLPTILTSLPHLLEQDSLPD